jgi:hypothetical protein
LNLAIQDLPQIVLVVLAIVIQSFDVMIVKFNLFLEIWETFIKQFIAVGQFLQVMSL